MKKINLLDKNSNASIILAGILALIIGVGVARFVFTSLLPPMLEDYLTVSFAGILASVNYAGYLAGSIFAVFIKDIYAKVKFFRLGMIISILTTLVLATTHNETLWLISRIIAGFGAAMALVVGSAIVMYKLKIDNKTKAMGIHFSGIGFSILVTDLIVRAVFYFHGTWQEAWLVLTIFAFFASFYSMYILSFGKRIDANVVKHHFDIKLFSPFVILLIIAYFCEGVGFVVQATFIPDIINSLEGLKGYGNLTWTLVGLAGIPSCIIWMNLAHKYGSVNIIIIAMLLQVVGILISALTNNLYLNLLSGVLYGGTFIGLVALFMNLGGKLSGANPVVLMGALTTAYGVGQVLAPLYSIALIDKFGNYTYALYLTAFIVFSGVALLFISKILNIVKE
ncbi:major facilitator superfamily MFS_1 [Arcobacter nitrofigilis DSM 7299]|uniref:Major facilitator superfamily MFS_1 n=1 Tax=Arcobacter nitrofigilis (strain ATCC 33309 / DSM 7299 / CCUG 15893 / LMG 7604 / NCTC 12251 / CI) TaxID=572480 RepID=D5V6S2_ARCNC|nr:YbfB/YjiJ family MFS transporter [Arcobacter nitrofigilis]ADG94342.1 major facilitator superfamily MFS_1 [Arcobacter nitrofigilis DSM 7299]